MTSSKTRLLLGTKAETGFGKIGCSHSMYGGGFDYYVYGLWPFISVTYYFAWGDFCHDNPNLK